MCEIMINRFFKMAIEAAKIKGKDIRRCRFGVIGLRKDGKIIRSKNMPFKNKNYKIHAEYRLCAKLDLYSIVFVVRVRRDNKLTLAKPCDNCIKAMKLKKVRKCFYSINENEYGVLHF